jgi:hypothetical protein
MAQNRGFSCPTCGEDFDTRQQLDNHNRREHQRGGQGDEGGMGGSRGRRKNIDPAGT